jgi:hypothetical protein
VWFSFFPVFRLCAFFFFLLLLPAERKAFRWNYRSLTSLWNFRTDCPIAVPVFFISITSVTRVERILVFRAPYSRFLLLSRSASKDEGSISVHSLTQSLVFSMSGSRGLGYSSCAGFVARGNSTFPPPPPVSFSDGDIPRRRESDQSSDAISVLRFIRR